MPDKRDLSLNRFGITKAAYRELLYFCRQYEEKKHPNIRGFSEETKSKILQVYADDIRIIDDAAEQTGGCIKEALIKNVCYGISADYMDFPYGRRQFYEIRRFFFVRLYELKNKMTIERKQQGGVLLKAFYRAVFKPITDLCQYKKGGELECRAVSITA